MDKLHRNVNRHRLQCEQEETHQWNVELFLELELSRVQRNVYTFASISYPIYHICIHFDLRVQFSISFLSNAVPPISPKILSFIILCHRGGGWVENIERDPTINSIRSQSKNPTRLVSNGNLARVLNFFSNDILTKCTRSCFSNEKYPLRKSIEL